MTEHTEAPAKNKGGRPKGSKTKAKLEPLAALQTPEGQEVLQAAVEAAMAKLTEKLAEARGPVAAIDENGDQRLLRGLAAAIAEIGDQDAKVKRVPPEEMEARRIASEKMADALIDARTQHERYTAEAERLDAQGMDFGAISAARAAATAYVPSYDLKREVYLDEVLVPATYVGADHVRRVQNIDWWGVPNEAMVPTNDVARAIFSHFMRSIGGQTVEKKVPYKRAADKYGLSVKGADPRAQQAREVGQPRGPSNLHVHRPGVPGEVVRTNVLGTLAEPARQVG